MAGVHSTAARRNLILSNTEGYMTITVSGGDITKVIKSDMLEALARKSRQLSILISLFSGGHSGLFLALEGEDQEPLLALAAELSVEVRILADLACQAVGGTDA